MKDILKQLEDAGWHQILDKVFQWYDSNRYVEIDYPYIDIYVYVEGEKYLGYLAFGELHLFNELCKLYEKEVDNANEEC